MEMKLLIITILFCFLSLTACNETSGADSHFESSATSFLEEDDSPLSMRKLIFSYAIHFPESENAGCEYFLFVQSDGSIYTGVYSDFYTKQLKFQRQLYGLNDVDFELLDDIKHIGYLSDSEVKALSGLIEKINSESQAYNRNETELTPTVVDTVYYTFFIREMAIKWRSELPELEIGPALHVKRTTRTH